jgi:holin-like protein
LHRNDADFAEGESAEYRRIVAEQGCSIARVLMMIAAFFLLLVCELIGELARAAFNLPVPGPVIGMLLLAAALSLRKDKPGVPAIPGALCRTAESLISHMGLLFVPAGVGIITEVGLLRAEWLPILTGLIGSTILSLAATGLVMHWTMRPRRKTRQVRVPARPGPLGHHGSAS